MSNPRDRWSLFLLVALLLPLFAICVRHTHDWGDDFAQYIVQARDLCNGDVLLPDRAVINWPAHGPAPKGLGFSMLLIPVNAAFDVQVAPYLVLNVFVVIITAVFLFRYLRTPNTSVVAVIGALLFAYDRHVLQAATEIMPDLLLTLCVVLLMAFLDRPAPQRWWWMVLITACALLLKSAAWLLWLVLCWDLVRCRWKKGAQRAPVSAFLCGVLLPPLVGVLLPMLLSRSLAAPGFWYAELFDAGALWERMGTNAVIYAREVAHYFEQELPLWMNRVLVPVVLLSAAIGCVRRCARGIGPGEVLLVLWVLMLLIYPDINSAARFMLPMLPIMLVYVVEGSRWIALRSKLPSVALPFALGLFLVAHTLSVRWFAWHDKTAAMGPYAPAAQEAFGAVERMVPVDVLVASTRPWALHLFTGRTGMWAPSPSDPGRPVPHVADLPPAYMLVATSQEEAGMFDEGLLLAVRSDVSWTEVWRNDRFTLVQRQTVER